MLKNLDVEGYLLKYGRNKNIIYFIKKEPNNWSYHKCNYE